MSGTAKGVFLGVCSLLSSARLAGNLVQTCADVQSNNAIHVFTRFSKLTNYRPGYFYT